MTIIQLLDALWTRCHEQRVVRAEEARKWVAPGPSHRKWAPWAEDLIRARDKTAKQSQVVAIVSNFIDHVSVICFDIYMKILIATLRIEGSVGLRLESKVQTSLNLVGSLELSLQIGIKGILTGKRFTSSRFMNGTALVVYIKNI
jgi:hypothetical protein